MNVEGVVQEMLWQVKSLLQESSISVETSGFPTRDDSVLGDGGHRRDVRLRMEQVRELLTGVAVDLGSQEGRCQLSPSGHGLVVVVGPSGTEPQGDVTYTRFDPKQSVVYSRCCIEVPPPLPCLPHVAPGATTKDSPPACVTVCVDPPVDSGCARWTRTSTRLVRRPQNYTELSSFEDSSDTDVESDMSSSDCPSFPASDVPSPAQAVTSFSPSLSAGSNLSSRSPSPSLLCLHPPPSSPATERETQKTSCVVDRELAVNSDCTGSELVDGSEQMESIDGSEGLKPADYSVEIESIDSSEAIEPVDGSEGIEAIDGSERIEPGDCSVAGKVDPSDCLLPSPASGSSSTPPPPPQPSGIMTVFNEIKAYSGYPQRVGFAVSKAARKSRKKITREAVSPARTTVSPARTAVSPAQMAVSPAVSPAETTGSQLSAKSDSPPTVPVGTLPAAVNSRVPAAKVVLKKLSRSDVNRIRQDLRESQCVSGRCGGVACVHPCKCRGGEGTEAGQELMAAREVGDIPSQGQNTASLLADRHDVVSQGKSAVTTDKPVKPPVTSDQPVKPVVTSPVKPVVTSDKPVKPPVTVDKPVKPVVVSADWSSDSDFDDPPGSGRPTPAGRRKTSSGALPEDSGVEPPDVIPCTSCGVSIEWLEHPILQHPRLRVLICQACFKRFNAGRFTIDGTNEDYCTLCGDGGNLVCCSTCVRSVCCDCIERLCGSDDLDRITSCEDESWSCFSCDSSPILEHQRMNTRLLAFLERRKSKARRVLQFDGSSGGGAGGNNGGRQYGSSKSSARSARDSGSAEKSRNSVSTRGSTSKDGCSDKASTGGGGSDTSGSGDRRRRSKRGCVSRQQNWSDFSSESDSDSNQSSSEVGSSEVSLSDLELVGSRRMMEGRRQEVRSHSSSSVSSSDSGAVSRSRRLAVRTRKRSLSTSSMDTVNRPVKKRGRLVLAHLLSSSSEEEEGFSMHTVHLSSSDFSDSRGHTSAPTGSRDDSVQYHSPEERQLSEEQPERSRKLRKRGSGPVQRRIGQRAVDSESLDSDFEEDLSRKGPRVGHRRVRKIMSSSDSELDSSGGVREESEVEKEEEEERPVEPEDMLEKSSPGKKRKKIRKVMDESKLRAETRAAQQEEKERIERLKQRAKSSQSAGNKEHLVLERDPVTKDVLLEVRQSLVPHLKPHQREGIQFLFDACVENVKHCMEGGLNNLKGAILAHCMGLGKSLQVIAFVDAVLNLEGSAVTRVLVLSPVNTLHNWISEYRRWVPIGQCNYQILLMTDNTHSHRRDKLNKWFQYGGILFAGYQMFRNLALGKHQRKKQQKTLSPFLLDPGPDIIVCDEGHVMRNAKSSLSQVLSQVHTRCRIVLTGTPLQNNLLEYYTMLDFVKPNLLGTQREFTNRFMNPINNGQCRDSLPHDVRLMKQRAHILHRLLAGTVQRRDYRVLAECLPPKQEYVLLIRLSPLQDKLYRRYLDRESGYHSSRDLFSTFANLSKVWNHPWMLRMDESRKEQRADKDTDSDTSLSGFIVSDGSDVERQQKSVASRKKRKKRKSVHTGRHVSVSSSSRSTTPSVDRGVIVLDSDEEVVSRDTTPVVSVKSEAASLQPDSSAPVPPSSTPSPPLSWYQDLLPSDEELYKEPSGKLLFLLALLREAEALREKVLVFSQSILTLNIIEEFLGRVENGDWTPGLDYYRLDGSTRADMRSCHMRDFNRQGNHRLRLFLISTRAGSLGVNLVSANRVVIFDACWNPSHDLQAIFRTYRFGQTKPIFIYRLLAQGTMEEKIYDRQVTKQALSMRVVDERQTGRHFTASDLAELFTYCPAPPPSLAPSPSIPPQSPQADITLCSILGQLQPQWVVQFHEHNSLLEHIFDEELSEEERKAAWESYNAEKAAETARYNFQALHSRLEQSSSAPSSQFPPGHAVMLPATTKNGDVSQEIITCLMSAIQDVDKLTHLQQRKVLLTAQGVTALPSTRSELLDVNNSISVLYKCVTETIKKTNEMVDRFNRQSVVVHPKISQTVVQLRTTLLQKIQFLQQPNSATLPTRT